MKVLSFDAKMLPQKTTSLISLKDSSASRPEPHCIGAVVYDEHGIKIDEFLARRIATVEEDLRSKLLKIPYTHNYYKPLLKDFLRFFKKHSDCVVVYQSSVRSTSIFFDSLEKGLISSIELPKQIIDIKSILHIMSYSSVDEYVKHSGIEVPNVKCGVYNPLHDAMAIASCYIDIMDSSVISIHPVKVSIG